MSSAPDRSGGSVTFGERLRALRVAARLTQEALGERSGTTSRSIGNLERGRVRAPRPATAEALADALGLRTADREAFLALAAREYWAERQDGEDEAPAGPADAGPVDQGPVPPTPEAPAPAPPRETPAAVLPPHVVPSVAVAGPTFLAAERLAAETLGLWRREAADRGLTDPRPIDVRWHWHPASPLGPDALPPAPAPGFAPPSGRGATTPLPSAGSVIDLFGDLFEALPHRRLVVMGPAGSGKTGALVMLLLAALEHRMSCRPTSRWALPVPVWVRAAELATGEERSASSFAARCTAIMPTCCTRRTATTRCRNCSRRAACSSSSTGSTSSTARTSPTPSPGWTWRHPGRPAGRLCAGPRRGSRAPPELAHAAIVELESVETEEARAYLADGPTGAPIGRHSTC
ncbi:MAG: helix-turn-helix transcriptional regulator [Kineosporiaceae bacterium]